MIKVPNKVVKACNSDSLSYREYIVIAGSTAKIEIKANLFQTAYKDTHFIGTFNISYIKFTTENNIDFKKKEFDFFKEVNGNSFKVGHYIVTEVKDSDSFEQVSVTAYDNGLKFANQYKSSLDYASNKITLFQVLQECCNKCEVALKNTSIENGDFIVDSNQFTENDSFGNVVSAVAFMSCNFAQIDENGTLELLFNTPTNEVIEDYVELDDKRDTRPITSVSLGMSDVEGENVVMKDDDLIAKYGEHWLIINDCPFAYTEAKRRTLITAIFNKVKGFSYSSFVSKYSFKPYLRCGDLIKFRNKDNQLINSIVLRIESDYDDITLSAPSIIKASVNYQNPVSAFDIAKKTELVVDKQKQEIKSIISNIGDRTDKTTSITQDLDRIEASIGEIADITITKEGYGCIDFTGINKSEPIKLEVKPINDDISLLYPRINLYPSNDLYMTTRKIRFESAKYITYYDIPEDLLYLNVNVYDNFILDFETKSCYVMKRVGIDEYGTKYELPTPIKNVYDYPIINLEAGDYKICVECFKSAYIMARLMTQNIYTDQFATRVEMNSAIKQSAKEIDLSVNEKLIGLDNELTGKINVSANEINSSVDKKLNNLNQELSSDITQSATNITAQTNAKLGNLSKDLSAKIELKVDTDKVVSQINASADEINLKGNRITIKSDSFDLSKDGQIKATGGTIGGWHITGNALYSYIVPPQDYKEGDVERLQQILIDQDHGKRPTQEEVTYFDTNDDGFLDTLDLLRVQKLIQYRFLNSSPGIIVFDTTDWFRPIKVFNSYGEIINSFNVWEN